MTDDKALSLVPQINTAYDTVLAAEDNALKERIKLGELLNLAKGSMAHGQWTDFLKAHTKISHRSANVYMDLAGRKEVLAKKLKSNSQHAAILGGAAEMSIREAIKESRTDEEKAVIEERSRKAKLAKELAKAKASAPLKDLDADALLKILTETFDLDFLNTLADSLDKHITEEGGGEFVLKRRRLEMPENQLSV